MEQRFVAIAAEAAEQLGVFAALASPRPLEVLATKLALPTRRFRALVELLIAGGRLGRTGHEIRIGTLGDRAREGATVIVEVLRRDRALDARDRWSLRVDARALDVGPLLSVGAAASAAETLVPVAGEGVLLDAGGGLGDATRAFLTRVPRARAVVVDVPSVIAAARRHLADLADRITFLAGDLRTMQLPPCRVALISNVLHLHRPEDCSAILANVTSALSSGGMLAVKDVALTSDRVGPLRSLAFGLATQIFSDEGEVYPASQIARWLESCGLAEVSARVLARAPECTLATGIRTTR